MLWLAALANVGNGGFVVMLCWSSICMAKGSTSFTFAKRVKKAKFVWYFDHLEIVIE